MTPDPHGYLRLHRSLEFIALELEHLGSRQTAASVRAADAYFGGSPTEFLGEAAIALELLRASQELPPSLRAFVGSLADEIQNGLDQ
jgi:hypothetical protein